MAQTSGEITIPFELYRSVLEKSQSPDLSFVITNASYKALCEDNDIKLSIEYNIKVNNDNLKPGAAATVATNSSKLAIKLFNEKATILKSTIQYSKTSTDAVVDGTTLGSCILMNENHYNLFVTHVGRYCVKVELSVPYLTAKNNGMELMIPKSSSNSVIFKVPKFDTNIKIFNSFPDVHASNEYNSHNGKESNDSTIVFAKLPGNEKSLKAQWTIREEVQKQSNTQNLNIKPNVVVSQNTLCSIGEGLLLFKSQFNYNIISGVISLYNVLFDKNLNIINVVGDAIKKWEILDVEKPDSPNHTKQLQISLDYGVEGNYRFTVLSEASMKDTSGDAIINSMICKGDEISRQRGFLGIEARTNVEISEIGSEALNVVDTQELPPPLHSMASHPILMSYKFLDQRHSLSLRVKKNSDCAVLVSICEEAHYITTVSYSGKTLHKLVLKIKNTKQQFLKINIPFKYDVWSTLMDSVPIKCSIDGPSLLIPILKPGNSDMQNSLLIEIIILEQEPKPLSNKKGSYEFTMPKIDLQLRAAFATIYLPDGFKCSNFSGNLKNVSYFSSTPPTTGNTVHGGLEGVYGGARNKMMDYDRRSSISNGFMSKARKSSYDGGVKEQKKKKAGAGMIPVQIDDVITNTSFFFEQILLSGDKALNIKFDYVAPK